MNLLALDPGLRNPAVAAFAGGRLVHASRVKVPAATHKLPLGKRVREVSRLVREHAAKHGPFDELVSEWPRCYRRMKGDPADLFPLAGIGGHVAGALDVEVDFPTAPDWIGNLPKNEKGDPLGSPRGRLIWSCLDEAERACVVLSHDALDAVGVGLFKLGRLELVRSFIGATRDV